MIVRDGEGCWLLYLAGENCLKRYSHVSNSHKVWPAEWDKPNQIKPNKSNDVFFFSLHLLPYHLHLLHRPELVRDGGWAGKQASRQAGRGRDSPSHLVYVCVCVSLSHSVSVSALQMQPDAQIPSSFSFLFFFLPSFHSSLLSVFSPLRMIS